MINKSIIIIPTYNESENIELIINKIISNDDSNDVLVVDDNSPDGTSKLVENQKNIHNNKSHHNIEKNDLIKKLSIHEKKNEFTDKNNYEITVNFDFCFVTCFISTERVYL